jgi:hypothetical protein
MRITFHQNMSGDRAVRLSGAARDGRTYWYNAHFKTILEANDAAPGWSEVMLADDEMIALVAAAYIAGTRAAIVWTHEFSGDVLLVTLGNFVPMLGRLRRPSPPSATGKVGV